MLPEANFFKKTELFALTAWAVLPNFSFHILCFTYCVTLHVIIYFYICACYLLSHFFPYYTRSKELKNPHLPVCSELHTFKTNYLLETHSCRMALASTIQLHIPGEQKTEQKQLLIHMHALFTFQHPMLK